MDKGVHCGDGACSVNDRDILRFTNVALVDKGEPENLDDVLSPCFERSNKRTKLEAELSTKETPQ